MDWCCCIKVQVGGIIIVVVIVAVPGTASSSLSVVTFAHSVSFKVLVDCGVDNRRR